MSEQPEPDYLRDEFEPDSAMFTRAALLDYTEAQVRDAEGAIVDWLRRVVQHGTYEPIERATFALAADAIEHGEHRA